MGGAERSCLALSRWLYEHNLPHQIVTYVDRAGMAAHAAHPVMVVQLKPSMSPWSKIAALRRYFAANPPERKPLTSGYQPALHATIAGLRGFHNLMHDTPGLFTTPADAASLKRRLALGLSDRIVAHGLRSGGHTLVTSEYLQAETRRTFGVEADIVRMGGLSQTNAFRLRPVLGEIRLFTVSRLENNKRIDWILRALAQLPPTLPWRLDVSGKGSQMQALTELSASLGISERVHFHGFVSDQRLQQLYDQAHLFLMPAVQGYGIPAIEALQRGIPVLLHRESGVSDILLRTPWATVMQGDEASMLPALSEAIRSVRTGTHLDRPLPTIPTEEEWSERVAILCGWL
ncbi:Glycosyltransferase [Granulicella sibirica]|uniref:Glycosyltransferase n=2 Tax=Granulicella sibirica TaxID=2479048 RepID=A0A4Q0T000_9BACT|nr:Glycosyltransferase [Granulicella sibirica]